MRTQQEITEFATSTSRIMTGLLGAIASVSLLVGGIGIMNRTEPDPVRPPAPRLTATPSKKSEPALLGHRDSSRYHPFHSLPFIPYWRIAPSAGFRPMSSGTASATATMFEQAFKNIDDVLWKDAGGIMDEIAALDAESAEVFTAIRKLL